MTAFGVIVTLLIVASVLAGAHSTFAFVECCLFRSWKNSAVCGAIAVLLVAVLTAALVAISE